MKGLQSGIEGSVTVSWPQYHSSHDLLDQVCFAIGKDRMLFNMASQHHSFFWLFGDDEKCLNFSIFCLGLVLCRNGLKSTHTRQQCSQLLVPFYIFISSSSLLSMKWTGPRPRGFSVTRGRRQEASRVFWQVGFSDPRPIMWRSAQQVHAGVKTQCLTWWRGSSIRSAYQLLVPFRLTPWQQGVHADLPWLALYLIPHLLMHTLFAVVGWRPVIFLKCPSWCQVHLLCLHHNK